MKLNEWEEVINHLKTYTGIAKCLLEEGKCLIGWSDDKYDHRDILFTYYPNHLGGTLQRGMKAKYLYVSIIDDYCMGFAISENLTDGYIMEKLRLKDNDCDKKLCHLIRAVIKKMIEMRNYEKENND